MKVDSLNPGLATRLRDGHGSSELDALGLSEDGELTFEGALVATKLGTIRMAYHAFPCTCPTCGNDFGAMLMAWGDYRDPPECIYCATEEES